MAKPVGHKRNQAVGFAQFIENHLYKIDVHHLSVPAEIISLARFPLEKRCHDGSAMIRNVDPVANIQAVTINREWLVAQRYTSPAKLAIEGGSQGGIYVGRSITERPDLFGAAIDQVPVSDAIRSSFESNGELDKTEMGTTETEAGFRALLAMSPYHHIKDGTKYPAVMVVTGINDPRVDAWQAAKMAARLQAANTSGKPVLLRVDFDAGHGYGSTKKQRNEELADTLAFLLWQFGVKGFTP